MYEIIGFDYQTLIASKGRLHLEFVIFNECECGSHKRENMFHEKKVMWKVSTRWGTSNVSSRVETIGMVNKKLLKH